MDEISSFSIARIVESFFFFRKQYYRSFSQFRLRTSALENFNRVTIYNANF